MSKSHGRKRWAASYLFLGEGELLPNAGVEMNEKGEVTAIFRLDDYSYEPPEVEWMEGILTPGLVNAHTHLELSFFDGVFLPGGSMVAFLKQIDSLRIEINQEIIDRALEQAYESLRREGEVAYADIGNQADTVPFKKSEQFRSVSFVEMFGANDTLGEKAYQTGLEVLRQFQDAGIGSAYMTPHAPYSVGRKLLASIDKHVEGSPIVSLHFAETAQEAEFMRTGHGAFDNLYKKDWKREVDLLSHAEWLDWICGWGSKGKHILLIHCVRLTAEEMERLRRECPEVSVVLCPVSNLFIEGALADIPAMMESGIRIAVGSDSYSSSPTLSVLDQLKVIHRHYPGIPVERMLQWATRNGALALGMEELGLIRKGATPGLNLIEGPGVLSGTLQNAHVKPLANLHGLL